MRERERGREIFSDAPMSDRVWLMRLRWERVCEGGREGGSDGKHTHVSGLSQGCLGTVSGLSQDCLRAVSGCAGTNRQDKVQTDTSCPLWGTQWQADG